MQTFSSSCYLLLSFQSFNATDTIPGRDNANRMTAFRDRRLLITRHDCQVFASQRLCSGNQSVDSERTRKAPILQRTEVRRRTSTRLSEGFRGTSRDRRRGSRQAQKQKAAQTALHFLFCHISSIHRNYLILFPLFAEIIPYPTDDSQPADTSIRNLLLKTADATAAIVFDLRFHGFFKIPEVPFRRP